MDWALMETWKEREIPLHIVLRGIERSFDSFAAKPRKRSVKSLLYCQEEVEAQFAEWQEARIGAESGEASPSPNDDQEKTPFSIRAVREHLERCQHSLYELAAHSQQQGGDDFGEALSRAGGFLQDLQNDLTEGTPVET